MQDTARPWLAEDLKDGSEPKAQPPKATSRGKGRGRGRAKSSGKSSGKGSGKGSGAADAVDLTQSSPPPKAAAPAAKEEAAAAPAAPASPAAAPEAPSPFEQSGLFQGMVLCNSCGRFERFARCKLVSKQKNAWRCNGCQTKSTQLYRGLGSWPTSAFKALSDSDQQSFTQGLDGMDGPSAVARAKEVLQNEEEHHEYYKDGGEYLPLSVWQNRGFDSELVRTKSAPEDKKPHPIFGEVYRVRILEVGNMGRQGRKRVSNFEAQRDSRGSSSSANPNPAPQPPPEPTTSSSVTSSNSSSSSSSEKKKRNNKKGQKDKKTDKKKDKKRNNRGDDDETPAEKKARERREAQEQKECRTKHPKHHTHDQHRRSDNHRSHDHHHHRPVYGFVRAITTMSSMAP